MLLQTKTPRGSSCAPAARKWTSFHSQSACFFSLLAFCLSAVPGKADLINVAIDGGVEIQGQVTIRCLSLLFPCTPPIGPDAAGDSFTASDSGSSLGVFSLAKSGMASANGAGRIISADAAAQEAVSSSPNSFSVDLEFLTHVSFPAGAEFSAVAEAGTLLELTFGLTSPSLLHLTGSMASSGLVDEFLSLLPNQVPNMHPFTSDTIFDSTFLLRPGIYDLQYFGSTLLEVRPPATFPGETTAWGTLSLQADITEIPEPIWAPLVPALLVVASRCASKAKQRPAPGE